MWEEWFRLFCFRGGCFCFPGVRAAALQRRHHSGRAGVLTSLRHCFAGLWSVGRRFIGTFLINAIGARRAGTGYKISFDSRNPAFREWVRLSIPLMLGVSLVSADDWILRYFASGGVGEITRLNYAKRLLLCPLRCWDRRRGRRRCHFLPAVRREAQTGFCQNAVNGSVYRMLAASFLATALMMAAVAASDRSGVPARAFSFF